VPGRTSQAKGKADTGSPGHTGEKRQSGTLNLGPGKNGLGEPLPGGAKTQVGKPVFVARIIESRVPGGMKTRIKRECWETTLVALIVAKSLFYPGRTVKPMAAILPPL